MVDGAPATKLETAIIVYDGDCPFCTRYTSLLRLRKTVGDVKLIDARQGGEDVTRIQELGYDLDEGMVLELDGQFYHGADCINKLAELSADTTMFSRTTGLLFRSESRSRALYPVLRTCRNLVLRLLGRRPIKVNLPSAGQVDVKQYD